MEKPHDPLPDITVTPEQNLEPEYTGIQPCRQDQAPTVTEPGIGRRYKETRKLRRTRRRLILRTALLHLAILCASAIFLCVWANSRTAKESALPEVILLPLDSRPVNTDLPRGLASIAGISVTLPAQELLDQFLTPSDPRKLYDWLYQQREDMYDISILHINELLFGSLIYSRESDQYQDANQKLSALYDYLLQRNPLYGNQLILVYIMPRLLPSQYNDTMQAYENELPELSQLRHRLALDRNDRELADRITALEAIIPREIITRYESVYTEAYNVGLNLMDWLDQGLVDEIIIGLDDSAEFGLNVKSFNDLKFLSSQRGQPSAYFLHGADELSPLIIARHTVDDVGAREDFVLRYLSEEQEHILLPYEALPLKDTFIEKVNYLTDDIPHDDSGANSLTDKRINHLSRPKYIYVFTDQESSPESLRTVWKNIRSGKDRPGDALTGLVDVAKVNGAWAPLIESAKPTHVYRYVNAYAGWNTAGNSLGTVMAQLLFFEAAQRLSGQAKREALIKHENLQKLRIIDDYFFQSVVRPELIAWTVAEGFPYLSFGGRWMEANDKLSEMMEQALIAWPELAPSWNPIKRESIPVWQYRFPWPRSFEIRIAIQ